MIRAVIFDFGGVVVDWDMRHLFRQLFDDVDDMEVFLTDVLTPAENLRVDLGTPLAAVVGELIARHPQHTAPLEAWRDRWIETIPGAIPGTATLIREVRQAGLGVFGLSNFSAETFPWCRSKYPVFEQFDGIVLSGEFGAAKPDPAIYHNVCDLAGVAPDQALFFDDSPANVAGALAVGMHGLLFTTAANARRELVSHGVLPVSA